MLSVLAVDDEPLALRRVEALLARTPGVRLSGTAAGRDEALAAIAAQKPDAVLLDIHMRDGSGFDVVAALPPDSRPAIVFVTAFDHFAIRAFEVAAIDYILKPIEPARLAAALDRVRASMVSVDAEARFEEMNTVIANLRARIAEREGDPHEREVWLRGTTGALTRVDLDDVEWVSSEAEYIRLHTNAGSHLLRLSITGLERKVDPRKFVRVHRRALVRTDRIREVRRGSLGGSEVVLTSGQVVGAGRIYAKQLRQAIAEFERSRN